jgi:hypothetical protein
MPSIKSTIEIASPPSAVRATFLNFPRLPDWHKGFFKHIEPHNSFPNSDRRPRTGLELKPGDKIAAVLGEGAGTRYVLPVVVNTEEEFRWRNKWLGVPGLLVNEHYFRFEKNGEGTRFVQGEDFEGVLGYVMKEGGKLWTILRDAFVVFNGDLKARCESSVTA